MHDNLKVDIFRRPFQAYPEHLFVYHDHDCQEEDLNGCLLKRSLLCCCCVLATKPKERGLILMENLKVSHVCWQFQFIIERVGLACQPKT